jgi:DNA-binding transcriptional LysR family regulator
VLLLDAGFVVRKTFDTVCRLIRIKPNILFESGVPHNLLAFAEAGLGIAIIPSVVRTHRRTLRLPALRTSASRFGSHWPTSGARFPATSRISVKRSLNIDAALTFVALGSLLLQRTAGPYMTL